jgi:hypothetical protein
MVQDTLMNFEFYVHVVISFHTMKGKHNFLKIICDKESLLINFFIIYKRLSCFFLLSFKSKNVKFSSCNYMIIKL